MEQFHYFGKLRRRREFLKAAGLARDYYYDWEVWFNKCSNANSLLPFLSAKNKVKPIWLFVIHKDEALKTGLTTLSSDMAERKHPFLIYYEHKLALSEGLSSIRTTMSSIATKYEGFAKTIANGDFTTNEAQYFASPSTSHEVVDQLQDLLHDIALNILQKDNDLVVSSYWVNLDSFSVIYHTGAFTCTLYNKIYG